MEPAEVIELTWFSKSLLGLVGVGFLTWAGVVWRAVIAVRETAGEIKAQLERLTLRIELHAERMRNHEDLPWHRHAGEEITRLTERLNHLERGNRARDTC